MNEKQTRQVALLGSIKHWIENANAESIETVSIGSESCSCCEIWNDESTDHEMACMGCPIYDFTGQKYCRGTPFEAAYHFRRDAIREALDDLFIDTGNKRSAASLARFQKEARKEVKFLMKVLKKELK
jgi:hypothetical protein